MSGSRRVVHAVYDAPEFNTLLSRLPRSVRRGVKPAPPGHVGMIVEIVSAEDCRLATVCEHVPATADLARELSQLEAKAHDLLA